jgi:hypothetical protein
MPNYKCVIANCSETFPTKRSYKQHMRKLHKIQFKNIPITFSNAIPAKTIYYINPRYVAQRMEVEQEMDVTDVDFGE